VLHYLAAAAPEHGIYGYKIYTASRQSIRSLVMLYSSVDGQLLALVEANWLGAMRTGAASALATTYLARPESAIVGLIGTGNQAVTQLMGICAVRPVTEVFVHSRSRENRERFCQEMARAFNVAFYPVDSVQQTVEYADIVITATTAKDPVLRGEWLMPGCHINAIGSNWPQRRELDSELIQQCALIVTDSLKQAQEEAGDLIIPVSEGKLSWDNVHELARVVSGTELRRAQQYDITLFKSLGVALEDVATAAHVYNLACQQELGDEIDLLS
jgi:ornithine cyclodeaminase/alanine dehydrogenase-like protein (mu-crystallin family)